MSTSKKKNFKRKTKFELFFKTLPKGSFYLTKNSIHITLVDVFIYMNYEFHINNFKQPLLENVENKFLVFGVLIKAKELTFECCFMLSGA